MDKINKMFIITEILLLFLLIIQIYHILNPDFFSKKVNNFTECANFSLEKTAYCLRGYVKGFYNYTIREDTEKTFEDIKENGGDCYDWTMLYKSMAESLGFKTKVIKFYTNNSGHIFLIMYDNSGYCEIDELNVNCIELD